MSQMPKYYQNSAETFAVSSQGQQPEQKIGQVDQESGLLEEEILSVLPIISHAIFQLHIGLLKQQNSSERISDSESAVSLQKEQTVSLTKLSLAILLNKLILADSSSAMLEQFFEYLNSSKRIYEQIVKQVMKNAVLLNVQQNIGYNQYIEEIVHEIVNQHLSQICIKILQILNWLSAYKFALTEQQQQSQNTSTPIQSNPKQSITDITNILIGFTGTLGKRSKYIQQQNYYFTKLVGYKKNRNWTNQFIGIWLAKKKQIAGLFFGYDPMGKVKKIVELGRAGVRNGRKWEEEFIISNHGHKNLKSCGTYKQGEEKNNHEKNKNKLKIAEKKNQNNQQLSRDKNLSNKLNQKQKIQPKQNTNNLKLQSENQHQKIELKWQQKTKNIQLPNHKIAKNLAKEQKNQKKERMYKNQLNILNYIKKYFTVSKKNNNEIQLAKQLYHAQHLLIKNILTYIIRLAKINNPRLNSDIIGDQFRYYCPYNKISHNLLKNTSSTKCMTLTSNQNNQMKCQHTNLNSYKLTYPSKLQSYFTLRYHQYHQQLRAFEILTQAQSAQNHIINHGPHTYRRFPHQVSKYLYDEWTKQKPQIIQVSIRDILSTRLKISTYLIRDVIIDKFSWIFAAEKGLYKF